MPADEDFEKFKLILDLWKSENPVKTNKLQVLLLFNGILVSTIQITGGFTRDQWPLYLLGAGLSLVWLFSIGRTVFFQRVWQVELERLASTYQGDPRFQVLNTAKTEKSPSIGTWTRALGSLSSRYYLLGAPLLSTVGWLLAVIIIAARA